MFDRDAYRRESLSTWGTMAPGWEDRREWLMDITGPVNARLIEGVDPKPGERILEIAAGTGDLGFLAAERVGEDGTVVSTDFAPEMVDVAQRASRARGLGNVEHRVLDAERMDFEDDSFDGVLCRWGYMLMADPAAALGETRRVLRDGRSLGFAVWAAPQENPWAAVPAMTLVRMGHLPAPEPGMPGIFALADPELTRGLVSAAGFGSVELEQVSFEFRYPDFDDAWDALMRLAGPLARVIEALDEPERARVREEIAEGLAPYRDDDGSYTAPALTWCGFAS
jgi:SAM-dependent methyltransferase